MWTYVEYLYVAYQPNTNLEYNRTPEYRSGTLMLVRTILTQKLASTLMQSGQSCPILRGYPDDYPDKNAAPRSLMVPSCHVSVAGRLGWRLEVSNALCATLSWIFLPFPVYIYVNNGAKFRMFTYSDKFGAPKNFGTLILSGQNLTKSGSLCPDINGSLPSGFLTYIRGS